MGGFYRHLFAIRDVRSLFTREAGLVKPKVRLSKFLAHFPDASSRAFYRRRRIVQFVSESSRELSESGEFIPLLGHPCRVADTVQHQSHQPLGEHGHSLQHFRKELLVKAPDSQPRHSAGSPLKL